MSHSGHYPANTESIIGQSGVASGVYQVGQTLGSIGTPTSDLRVGKNHLDNARAEFGGGGHTAPPATSGLPGPDTYLSHRMDSMRQTQFSSRPPEELHIPQIDTPMGQSFGGELSQQYLQNQTRDLGGGPGINVQQATPQGSQNMHGSKIKSVPGALQPGRQGLPSMNTAPSTIPTLPQIHDTQQFSTPSRATTNNHTHAYSHSSPAGLDQQKYVPYANTPESSKYASPTNMRYTSSQTPQTGASYSPLGLADIRPRADSGLSDGPQSANPYANEGFPTNSNYLAPWPVYAFDWCKWPVQSNSADAAGKMAIGSYVEDGHNFIQILDTRAVPESDLDLSPDAPQFSLDFVKSAEATHSCPVTRILWEPASSQKQSTDLLATSGDHLRLWSLPSQTSYNPGSSINRTSNASDSILQKLTPLALLSNSKSPEHTAPLTSLDWNTLSPSLIITSSIDTTCTIWDIPTLTAKTQLIAHDKEVFDVRFCANSVDVFVSCGADGSVRMFDLRSLEHSTIIYEPSEKGDKSSSPGNMSPTTAQQTMSYAPPLLRLAASPHDAHLLATFSQDSNIIRILDVRQPGQALMELRGHAASINCIEWSPSRRGTLASGGDDSLVLVWDLLNQTSATSVTGINGVQQVQSGSVSDSRGPAASWLCDYEVGNISWSPQSCLTSQGGDWIGVSGGRGVWGVNL